LLAGAWQSTEDAVFFNLEIIVSQISKDGLCLTFYLIFILFLEGIMVKTIDAAGKLSLKNASFRHTVRHGLIQYTV
jgi:hypothetical protein